MGICISSVPQSLTYSIEFFPKKFRSFFTVIVGLAYGLGACFEALLALLVMQSLGWRYLMIFSTLPTIFALFLFPCVPPSPRYLLACGEVEQAFEVIESVAKQNCRRLPAGELVAFKTDTSGEDSSLLCSEEGTARARSKIRGNILEMFSSKYLFTTLILLFFWFTTSFTYYGIVLFSTQFSVLNAHCSPASNATVNPHSVIACSTPTNEDYIQFLISSFAEFPGMFLLMLLNDTIGRKLTKTFFLSAGAVTTTLLLLCTGASDRIVKTILMFAARSSTTAALQNGYLYAPEVYPTAIRASALSLLTMMSRIGGILTPFAGTVLIHTNLTAAVSVYVSMLVAAAVLTLLLPFETRGNSLGELRKRRLFC